MNYKQTVEYLYAKLPMFTKIGKAAFKKDLTNTLKLCNALNNPQNKFKSIHVAGTNGKGSTSHMLASIFMAAGYKTALYTSPHLRNFRERIKINGKLISENDVVQFVKENIQLIETVEPSFFECTVAMAFSYFAKNNVDIAIIETGLGGRLDSTNIITPVLSIITNIDWDHMDMLGNTLPEIASEKAGIIKENIPVIIGEYTPETKIVFANKATALKSNIYFATEETTINNFKLIKNGCQITAKTQRQDYKNLYCDLGGIYQKNNLRTIICSAEILNQLGYKLSLKDLANGLGNIKTNTALEGRWQIIKEKPLIIADVGHNKAGISYVVGQIATTNFSNLHWVFGVVKDKDFSQILSMLPKHATYYFTKANLPRALNENDLLLAAKAHQLNGKPYNTVELAIKAALQAAKDEDLIFIGGSTFVVAEALAFFN